MGQLFICLYPTLLASYITTATGSPFCPGHKFPGIPFLWLSLPTVDKNKRSIKIFIWSWHNVQLRLKLGYSGQSYFFRQAGTDCKGTDMTCSQLRAQGQHNTLLDAKCLLVCNGESKIRLVMSPKTRKCFSSPLPPGSLEYAEVKLWFV